MNARVSVILPTYQRAAFLRQSLDSVLGQSHRPAQVIVVDDGSTDATPEVLAAYAGRVTVLRQANAGKPAAINAGLAVATGDYLWIFDDDDVACPDALARHLAVLERRPDVGFTCSGSFRCHDGPDGRLLVDSAHPLRPFPDDEYYLELLLSGYTAGPAVVVRTSVQRAAGPYRTDLLRSEDFEIATRWGLVARAGRLDEPAPAYYRRTHPGPRGAASERFAAGEIVRRARDYERRIVRELGARLDLCQYLPHPQWAADLTAESRARALFRRGVVSLRKGLWDVALADLAQLAALRPAGRAFADDVQRYAGRALNEIEPLRELAAAPAAARELGGLLALPVLRAIRHAILRQLYYRARSSAANQDWRDALLAVVCGGKLLWPGGLRTAASDKAPQA